MKKLIAALLLVALCVGISACGSADPFAKEYGTIDEVVSAIVANYTGKADQAKAIAENESMAKYFQEDQADQKIWKLLETADGSKLTLTEIYDLYSACSSQRGLCWYDYINVGDGIPFGHYEFESLTLEYLQSSIKNKFKDPDSVRITNAKIAYVMPEGVTDPNGFDFFEKGFRYHMYAEIYAKNSYGGGSNDLYHIEGNALGWTFSVSSASGNSVQDPGVSAAFKRNGCGQAVLITE